MNELTVIIPFLNEGVEIENTLHNIRETVGNTVDVLLINDCSTDEYDYKKVALRYAVQYYKNEERKGVAASRDWGISKITTPYFLLLDGHMRFFQNNWVHEILDAVKNDERAIYCCRCKDLALNTQNQTNGGYAAYIHLFEIEKRNILTLVWLKDYDFPDKRSIVDVPCILGASYVANKEYWQYLNGLTGLRYYGCDEQYISLKAWMEGGKCRLIKTVEIGHWFRTVAPYKMLQTDFYYNKLLIINTLLPEELQKKMIRAMKAMNYAEYIRAKNELTQRKEEIMFLKDYYTKILKAGFDNFMNINEHFRLKHLSKIT
jgi:glycosyltransferase involved in cell wall biosynthesis